jgi:iron complex outermembrane recepter protein
MRKSLFTNTSFAALAVAVLGTGSVQAQTAQSKSAEAQAAEMGDIVVTATRESTLLSKTPIAITAISTESLRDSGVTDARSLNDVVPNLAISENGDSTRISIRGVTSSDQTEKGDPSAAFLIDGIYIARPIEVLNSFYDLERVEVLRGPQGTLYGRNTTAGVINVISAPPKDEFGASIDGKYGNLNSTNVTGMVNVPVADGLGLRAAVTYDRQDSPIIQKGPVTQSLNPFRNTRAGRLSFGGNVGENIKFIVRGDYSQAKGAVANSVPLTNFFPGALVNNVNPVYVSKSTTEQRTLPVPLAFRDRKNNKFYGVMGEFTYDFGSMAMTYLGSYRKADREDTRNLLLFGALNNPAFFFGKFNQTSHELRLAFGKDSPLHGQVGAYYFKEKSNIEFNLGAPLSGLVVPGATGFAFPQGPTKASSKAGFGQLTYDITPDFHLTAGIRYTKDNKSRVGATVVDFPAVTSSICGKTRCVLNENIAFADFKKTTWKFGADYDVPELGLLYASVSSGYKAGGFNDGCLATSGGVGCTLTADQLFFSPETLRSYEAGFKFRLMENKVRLNASLFHYDYKDLQLSQIVTVPVPATRIRNAGVAKVDGIELEAVLRPTENDTIDLAFTYTDARYSAFQASPTVSFAGRALDHAPKYTASAGFVHSFPLGDGSKVEAAVRTRLSSAYFIQDLGILAQYRQPSHSKTNLSLTYKAPDDRYYVQGFLQNLENEITLAAASSGLVSSATIEEPRTFGVRAGFKF